MATYFNHGSSEIQGPDGLHTLYLMNPNNNNNNNYVQTYSDTTTTSQPPPPPAPNMFFLNPNQLHHSRHLAGVPISAATASPGPGSNNEADISAFPHLQYNIWGSNMDHHQRNTTPDFATQMGFRRHQVVSPTTQQQQALSLSLSSTHPAQAAAYVASSSFSGGDINNEVVIPTVLPTSFGNSLSSTIVSNNSGIGTSLGQVQSMLLGSKYLKAAQELLDEVVNVGNNNNNFKSRGKEEKDNTAIDSSVNCSTVGGLGSKDKAAVKSNGERTPTPELGGSRNSGGESSSSKISAELSTVQRQELQVKKAKLASMLDEVEQRYRQYHQQMNVVISSFEQAVGYGSAKSYTALALKTISKQFRCLKDAISAQIKATSKTLGEEECLGVKIEGSRLRFVDHHLRQQRALQQLGMMPQHNNNAWRPQRGLPERAVSVLRAWLFEHFLHPYPKTADKVMLAKQTGLTRSQVSNWFINARVRLWKPMVEEMYIEETKSHEDQVKGTTTNKIDTIKESTTRVQENSTADNDDDDNIDHHDDHNRSNINPFQYSSKNQSSSSADQMLMSSSFSTSTPKKPMRSSSITHDEMIMKGIITDHDHQYNRTDHNINNINIDVGFGRSSSTYPIGFGTYPVGDLARFHSRDHHHHHEFMAPSLYHGNNNGSVSLTLGLPHCDQNHSLSSENAQQSFLSNPQNIDPLFD
ncbi:hypothetical protein CsatA_006302 [Cannabis sativa]